MVFKCGGVQHCCYFNGLAYDLLGYLADLANMKSLMRFKPNFTW